MRMARPGLVPVISIMALSKDGFVAMALKPGFDVCKAGVEELEQGGTPENFFIYEAILAIPQNVIELPVNPVMLQIAA